MQGGFLTVVGTILSNISGVLCLENFLSCDEFDVPEYLLRDSSIGLYSRELNT